MSAPWAWWASGTSPGGSPPSAPLRLFSVLLCATPPAAGGGGRLRCLLSASGGAVCQLRPALPPLRCDPRDPGHGQRRPSGAGPAWDHPHQHCPGRPSGQPGGPPGADRGPPGGCRLRRPIPGAHPRRPSAGGSPLGGAGPVVYAPHLGGITSASFRRSHAWMWASVQAMLEGGRPGNVVNGL